MTAPKRVQREVSAAKYRKALKEHTESVTAFLVRLDQVMAAPSSADRGRQVARLSGVLEMANDRVRYGILGINFRKDAKPAARAALEEAGCASK